MHLGGCLNFLFFDKSGEFPPVSLKQKCFGYKSVQKIGTRDQKLPVSHLKVFTY
jgi:hypothetical protein